jgi:thioredoxin-related protein
MHFTKGFLVLLILFLTFNMYSQERHEVNWISFSESLEKSKKDPKPVFIDVYTDWCGWCKRMDATTFKDSAIANYLNSKYYAVKMNAEMKDTINFGGNMFVNTNPTGKRSSHQIAIALLNGKMSYPSYAFLNEKYQKLTVLPGYRKANELLPILQYFGEGAYLNTSWEDYMAAYNSKISTPKDTSENKKTADNKSLVQTDTTATVSQTNDSVDKSKLRTVLITEGALYGGSLFALNNLWYKDYPRSSFHFFNDNDEWLQMDKIGHASTGYLTGRFGYELFKYAGLNEKQSIWMGGSLGFLYLLNIEILDGFSKDWGASTGDLAANALGAGTFIGQQLFWEEQRITMKYSFHQTKYPKYRKDLLGSNLLEQSVKDYNGQTYWFSGNIHSFLKEDSKFPSWLNISIGYSGEGMISGTKEDIPLGSPDFKRYRQFYFAPDVDFTRIETNSKILKKAFYVLNVFKFPTPAIEFSNNAVKILPIYF